MSDIVTDEKGVRSSVLLGWGYLFFNLPCFITIKVFQELDLLVSYEDKIFE